MQRSQPASLRPVALTLVLGAALVAPACSGSGGSDGPRKAVSTNQSTVVGGPVEILERYVAYLADEATTQAGGSDFNGDGDVLDSTAFVLNAAGKVQRSVGVAASDLAMVRTQANGTHLYMVVDEASDGTDWDGDLVADDLVLLHTHVNLASAPAFVATLADAALAKVGDRVYFSEIPALALVAPETSLMYVETALPTTPVRVQNAVLGFALDPRILGEEDGLLILGLDENVEARDLNADADATDAAVLALLDGTDPAAAVVEVPLALQDTTTPVRALANGSTWIVAFLVDEASQGATNLNDPGLFAASWKPTQCIGFEDADMLDEVLHYLDYTAFVNDPVVDAPRNTGLVGDDRVLVLVESSTFFVATVSPEAAEGTCDLNGDADVAPSTDRIVRWVEAVAAPNPILPFTDVNELVALAAPAGGTGGVTTLSGRFVAVVSELEDGRDHDGVPGTDLDLVAWLDPADGAGAVWDFDHSKGAGGIQAVATNWMAEQTGSTSRVGVAFPESSFGSPINGDGDTLDSVPTFMRFNGAGTELDFPGPAVAVQDANAGIEIVGNLAFYRVDEAADDRDWNQDGDKTDFGLFRTTVSTLQGSLFAGTLNGVAMPSVNTPDPSAAAVAVTFVASEADANKDLNQDGDTNDQVLRWFRVD